MLVLFVVIALIGFDADNFGNFFGAGAGGITDAAGTSFSFIGLDAVATAGEEVKNPRRLPQAVIGALVIVTTGYLLVAFAGIAAKQPAWFETEGAQSGACADLQRRQPAPRYGAASSPRAW